MRNCYLNTIMLLLLIVSGFSLCAQNNTQCNETILQANTLYEKGNFDEAISLLQPCVSGNVNSGERWQAFRLLTLAHLGNNQLTEARKDAENMLELNPTYHPSYLKDPMELIKLLKSVTVIPKFSLGLALSLGSNSTFPEVSDAYVVSDYQKTYTSKSGFQFGASVSYQLNQYLSLDFSALASQKSYQIDYAFSGWKVDVSEKLNYLSFPLMVKYWIMPNRKVRPYLVAGAFGGYLLYSNGTYHSEYEPQNQNFELTKITTTDRRFRWDAGITGGIGCSMKMKEGYAFVQAIYFKSFTNVVKPEARYQYNDLIYTYYYLDDQFKLNNLSIGLGYAFHLNYRVIRK